MAEQKPKSSIAKAAKYYVVNPLGVVHPVPSEDAAKALLKQPGYRMAEKGEIAALEKLGGMQTPKRAAGKKPAGKKPAGKKPADEKPA